MEVKPRAAVQITLPRINAPWLYKIIKNIVHNPPVMFHASQQFTCSCQYLKQKYLNVNLKVQKYLQKYIINKTLKP